MLTIVNLLDKAKKQNKLASDYKLALVIGVSQSTLGNYRHGRSLPDSRILALLCDMTHDDSGLITVQIEAQKAKTQAAREIWYSIERRLLHPCARN